MTNLQDALVKCVVKRWTDHMKQYEKTGDMNEYLGSLIMWCFEVELKIVERDSIMKRGYNNLINRRDK